MQVNSTTGYGYVTDTNGKTIQKIKCPIGSVIVEDGTWTDCSESDWNNISISIYKPDTMIAWGMNNVLSSVPDNLKAIAIASFIDFANKANKTSKDNFLAIANSIGLTDIANTIIVEAINQGAPISA